VEGRIPSHRPEGDDGRPPLPEAVGLPPAGQPLGHRDIESAVDALVADPRRFIQTGIGWVLADLARHAPERATRLVERHLERLDREVIDRHTKRLPRHAAYRAAKRTHRPRRR